MWSEPFLAGLAEHFDVVAFDHRGIGRSRRVDGDFSVADLAGDAVAVLDAVGWETAHVLGASMGGAVAQELVLAHPERVRRLVLCCTWAGPEDAAGATWGLHQPNFVASATCGERALAIDLMVEANLSSPFSAGEGRHEEFAAAATSVRVPGPVTVAQMRAAQAHDARDRLAGVATPTLVLHGTVDTVVLREAGERLAALIPGAALELFDGAGHLLFWEQPDRAAAAVTAHLLS
ncbi:alpha/beta fold hydrolase [Nocardioides humilatus]|uniref:Alpha/beta fold hydrolase n=2 Tax=Nocardioides humilatus TaxID=2607660 RepID=A0A5B1LH04_9ACTN|nr:alpha/beta fold hydrolase [Nocardioides humilatus]